MKRAALEDAQSDRSDKWREVSIASGPHTIYCTTKRYQSFVVTQFWAGYYYSFRASFV